MKFDPASSPELTAAKTSNRVTTANRSTEPNGGLPALGTNREDELRSPVFGGPVSGLPTDVCVFATDSATRQRDHSNIAVGTSDTYSM